MRFAKMEGLGNDFIVTHEVAPDAVESLVPHIARMCDRRRGIGADGVIFILPSTAADYRMRVFNADGSEAEMCGNGIRCVADYLDKMDICARPLLSIETGAGLITTSRLGEQLRVDMRPPVLDADKIPTTQESGRVIMAPLTVKDKIFLVTAVSMGNPHAVIFADKLTDELVATYGSALERHPFFPRRANVEFVRIVSPAEIHMRVFERGSGETLACGTGACASVVAGIVSGKLSQSVTVHLSGGDLLVEWDGQPDHSVLMTGPARLVFVGDINF